VYSLLNPPNYNTLNFAKPVILPLSWFCYPVLHTWHSNLAVKDTLVAGPSSQTPSPQNTRAWTTCPPPGHRGRTELP
jgi:hypothetical protein